MASFYLSVSTTRVGEAIDEAAERKTLKYASINNTHIFVPVAIETPGSICSHGLSFLSEINNRLATISGDSRESSLLFHRVSMLIQHLTRLCSEAPLSMRMTPKVNHSRLDCYLFLTFRIFTTKFFTEQIIIINFHHHHHHHHDDDDNDDDDGHNPNTFTTDRNFSDL